MTEDLLESVRYIQQDLKWRAEMTPDDLNFNGLVEDANLTDCINSDTYKIMCRARGKDGIINYDNTEGFFSDEYGCRSYCLTNGGGICIWCDSKNSPREYKILTLGEDDENYFLHSGRMYCSSSFDSKNAFLDCLSRSISLFNNNVTDEIN